MLTGGLGGDTQVHQPSGPWQHCPEPTLKQGSFWSGLQGGTQLFCGMVESGAVSRDAGSRMGCGWTLAAAAVFCEVAVVAPLPAFAQPLHSCLMTELTAAGFKHGMQLFMHLH